LMEGQAVQNMEKWGLSEQEFVLCWRSLSSAATRR
jgi:hypothetical protein